MAASHQAGFVRLVLVIGHQAGLQGSQGCTGNIAPEHGITLDSAHIPA
jgi:hypothetical protein